MTSGLKIDFLEEVRTKVMTFPSVCTIFCLVSVVKRKAALLSRQETRWQSFRLKVSLQPWFLLSLKTVVRSFFCSVLQAASDRSQVPALVTSVCPQGKVGFETEVVIVLWQMPSPENVLTKTKSPVRHWGAMARSQEEQIWGTECGVGLHGGAAAENSRNKRWKKKIENRVREQIQLEEFGYHLLLNLELVSWWDAY